MAETTRETTEKKLESKGALVGQTGAVCETRFFAGSSLASVRNLRRALPVRQGFPMPILLFASFVYSNDVCVRTHLCSTDSSKVSLF